MQAYIVTSLCTSENHGCMAGHRSDHGSDRIKIITDWVHTEYRKRFKNKNKFIRLFENFLSPNYYSVCQAAVKVLVCSHLIY
jgi:hypothetical protein